MIVIIGGAHQGKLDYAKENYPCKTIHQCDPENPEIDTTAEIINSLHLTILAQTRAGTDPLSYIQKNLPKLKEKILICDDISCGIVPIEQETRIWRENTGRVMALLSKNADEVIRVFCGIGSKIK